MPETVRFEGQGGDPIAAELYGPDVTGDVPGNVPGVVVVHEVFGLDAFTRSVAQRLADAGFAALAPDLYSREGLPGPASTDAVPAPEWPIETIRAAVAGIPDRRAVADLDAAAALLAERPEVDAERIAVLGFCMGGTLAFLTGCHSRRVAAVVDFYGRIVYPELSRNKPMQPLEMALNLDAPLIGFFGAEDPSIPLEDVHRLEQVLSQFAKPFETHTFPGAGHGFFNKFRSAHDPRASAEAWEKALAFLTETFELA